MCCVTLLSLGEKEGLSLPSVCGHIPRHLRAGVTVRQTAPPSPMLGSITSWETLTLLAGGLKDPQNCWDDKTLLPRPFSSFNNSLKCAVIS